MKSDLSDEIKQDFFKDIVIHTSTWIANKMCGEKSRWEQHKNTAHYLEYILELTPHKITAVWALASHLTNHSK